MSAAKDLPIWGQDTEKVLKGGDGVEQRGAK